jgi:hypothetical protein
MPVSRDQRAIVERYFAAMRADADGENAMRAVLAENAVYTEPFGGKPETHRGRDAIVKTFKDGAQQRPSDMVVTVDRVDLDDQTVVAEWSCASSAFPEPMRGKDRYTIENGRITRLETTLDGLPPTGG